MKLSTFLCCVLAAAAINGVVGPPAAAAPCSSYTSPIFCDDFDRYCTPLPGGGGACDPETATADNDAFHAVWPADGTCPDISTPDYLAWGPDVLVSYGAENVQTAQKRNTYIYRHVHDLTDDILAHPDNTEGAHYVNGAGPIDKPLEDTEPITVPSGYVDSMSSTLRPDALKGTFYIHPLGVGMNVQANFANMIYYHELFMDDDHAPMDFVPMTCAGGFFGHDCNCSGLHVGATCTTGICESAGPAQCVGECGFFECNNGVCSDGPHYQESCTLDADCSVCSGGPNDGISCSMPGDPVCKACDSGPHLGNSCTSNDQCPNGTCAAESPRPGADCAGDVDCGTCVGGDRDGLTCAADNDCNPWCDTGICEGAPQCVGQCAYNECNGTTGLCDGGPHDQDPCTLDSQCSVCIGGPMNGTACSLPGDTICKACDNDLTEPYTACTSNASCGHGTCAADSPRPGVNCTGDGDCGKCMGGHRDTGTCGDDWACQYSCGSGETAVCEGGVKNGEACPNDDFCFGTEFPILCGGQGAHPAGCPIESTVHASFAIGLVSIFDTIPCDLDQGYYPSEWLLVVYDGQHWHHLHDATEPPGFDIPGRPHPHFGSLFPLYGWNKIDFAIGAEYIEVRLTNIQSEALHSGDGACIMSTCKGGARHDLGCATDADCTSGDPMIPNEYLVARVPRKYKGPFNKYALGPAKGRDISVPASPGPEVCMPAVAQKDIISDEIVLYDGVYPSGACCNASGVCDITLQGACSGYGDRWTVNKTCAEIQPCCPYPFADADKDGDVDQVDFAMFQLCYTGSGGSVPPGCECWDQDNAGTGDGHIDAADFTAFNNCWTGPNVPFDPENPGSCIP